MADREPGPGARRGETDASPYYSVVLLDTGPLGLVTHPRREMREEPFRWLVGLRAAGVRVAVPEIADYELRRELLRAGGTRRAERLDTLEEELVYLPLRTGVMRRASRLWADARREGKPTAAPEALDGDAILAAQAQILEEELGEGVVVATTNPGHLTRFVAAHDWREIGPAAGDAEEEEEGTT